MSAPVSLQVFAGFFMFALAYAPLERCFPIRKQNLFRAGWTTDVCYYVVGCFVGKLSDAMSAGAMFVVRDAADLDFGSGIAAQPGWIQFFEVLLLADCLAYLYHRYIHRNAYLWRLHRTHHSSQQLDWLANVRLHPIDKILGDCFQFVPIFCSGFANAPVLAYTIFLGFQGFLNHSNIKVSYGPLRWLIASPEFHHWHHSIDPKAHNMNFSSHLVIFDMVFGTFYLPPVRSMPEQYGLAETMPAGFWKQMIHPFRGEDRSNRPLPSGIQATESGARGGLQ